MPTFTFAFDAVTEKTKQMQVDFRDLHSQVMDADWLWEQYPQSKNDFNFKFYNKLKDVKNLEELFDEFIGYSELVQQGVVPCDCLNSCDNTSKPTPMTVFLTWLFDQSLNSDKQSIKSVCYLKGFVSRLSHNLDFITVEAGSIIWKHIDKYNPVLHYLLSNAVIGPNLSLWTGTYVDLPYYLAHTLCSKKQIDEYHADFVIKYITLYEKKEGIDISFWINEQFQILKQRKLLENCTKTVSVLSEKLISLTNF